MQSTHVNHQFYSPVTNWISKNRRRERYLSVKIQEKELDTEASKIIFPRSQSLNCSNSVNVSPTATSKPITIPSSNKKVTFAFDCDRSMEKIDIKNQNSSITKMILTSAPTASPNVQFKKYGQLERVSKSVDNIPLHSALKKNCTRTNSLKGKKDKKGINVPKINTTSVNNNNKLENKSGSLELINNPDSSFSMKGAKSSNIISPQLSCSSISTACLSPSLTSNTSQEIENSSIITLCASPGSENINYLSMSQDQLFKLLPKKIIKALDNYTAHCKNEISYQKGDFFFVISENESYYFVTNPLTRSSGYVSKFSFKQVDNFARNSVVNKRLSPITEKRENNLILKEPNPLTDRIMTACITKEVISRNSQTKLPIEISKIDGSVAVIYRSYNEICELQNSLLECFPEDSGSNTKARILPFLPSYDAIINYPNKTPRQILSNYLQLLTQLPNYIQFSYPFEHFFSTRKDDILSSIHIVNHLNFFDCEEQKKSDDQMIKVKIIAELKNSTEKEVNILRISSNTKYFDLFDNLEARFNTTFTNIYYQNETNKKVKVFGDHDLKLFFNSNNLSYVLWAK